MMATWLRDTSRNTHQKLHEHTWQRVHDYALRWIIMVDAGGAYDFGDPGEILRFVVDNWVAFALLVGIVLFRRIRASSRGGHSGRSGECRICGGTGYVRGARTGGGMPCSCTMGR